MYSNLFQVLISKSNAVGVEYVRNGQKRTVGATKEVILTAGTIGSAHLLMLSGIGPKETLTKLAVS
jgi:choline dehydrogenase